MRTESKMKLPEENVPLANGPGDNQPRWSRLTF